MKRGVHEHLMFGDGEIDFAPVLCALRDAKYSGGVHVELSRHGHMAPDAARQSYQFLRSATP
jgi:sugar phosphate isomerase/epimerase